ncbi:hypothetical protein [Sphingobacterium hungaricum]
MSLKLRLILTTALVFVALTISAESKTRVSDFLGIAKHRNLDAGVTTEAKTYFQTEIDKTTKRAFSEKNKSYLENKIKAIESDNKIPQPYKAYWKTYLLYYTALYYKDVVKDDNKAEEFIEKAIANAKSNLANSEDYALYATCVSYSIQFASRIKMLGMSDKVKALAEKSLQLDANNVRAYCVLIQLNYFTPKFFGGMSKVESLGLEAIKLPIQSDNNMYAPRWGKYTVYDLVYKYYKSSNKTAEANKVKTAQKQEFPN